MEQVDLNAVTGDDQSFRFYMVMGLSALSERMANLSESVSAVSKEQAAAKERLVQIDLQGPRGLADRLAAHEKWMDDMRKQLSDHIVHCPMSDRMGALEKAMQDVSAEVTTHSGTINSIPTLQKQVQELTVAIAENTGAKGQKESYFRNTMLLVGMAISVLFNLIALFRKG